MSKLCGAQKASTENVCLVQALTGRLTSHSVSYAVEYIGMRTFIRAFENPLLLDVDEIYFLSGLK